MNIRSFGSSENISMGHIAQFRVVNPHRRPLTIRILCFTGGVYFLQCLIHLHSSMGNAIPGARLQRSGGGGGGGGGVTTYI